MEGVEDGDVVPVFGNVTTQWGRAVEDSLVVVVVVVIVAREL